MNGRQLSFWSIILKTIVVHTVTYTLMGLLASTLLDYGSRFADAQMAILMRPIDDPWVMAGPLFQPIRGILFGIVFYLLREVFFGRRNGWLLMWSMLVIVGILAVFGPTPGSLEGMLYTRLRWVDHLFGLPEVVLQALLLAVILFYWVNHPEKRWLTWVLGAAFVLCMAFPVLGLLVT